MARPRSPGNLDLPPHLYRKHVKGHTYFVWRDPRTGKRHPLGTDKALAILDASQLNHAVAEQIRHTRQAAQQTIAAAPGGATLGEVLTRITAHWQRQVETGKLKQNTVRVYGNQTTRIKKHFGEHAPIALIDVRDVAKFLGEIEDTGHAQMARALRALMIRIWAHAASLGEVQLNVAEVTLPPNVRVTRQRLELDEFAKVCAAAVHDVPRRAFRLALMVGQRVDVVSQLKFSDVRDGYLHVVPNKRGQPVRISLALRMDALGLTLGELIEECRATGVVSKFLIHHCRNGQGVKRGNRVATARLSHWFTDAYRAAGIRVRKGKTASTFHELRSLSKRTYVDQGNVDTKALLSHRDDKTAEMYEHLRGGWLTVEFCQPFVNHLPTR